MATVPTVEIGGTDRTALIQDKSISLRLKTLDFTLVDPSAIPSVGDAVTVDVPAWAGEVSSISTSEYEQTLFVRVTAQNEDVAAVDTAPFGISDTPNGTTTFGYRNLELTNTLYKGVNEVRGTLECFEPGLLPGMTFELTNVNNGLTAEEFPISDVTVSWLRDDYPVHVIAFGEEGVTLTAAIQAIPSPPPYVAEYTNAEDCSGTYPNTPTGTYLPNNSATTRADGIFYYLRGGINHPVVPTASFAGSWHFAEYGTGDGPDYAGDCAGNSLRTMVVGIGTIAINTAIYGPSRNLSASLYHRGPTEDVLDSSQTGVAGDIFTFDVSTHGGVNCVHWVDITDTGPACGSKWGFSGATWTLDTALIPPVLGETIIEHPTGVAASTTITTNYPYSENSLNVTVNGVAVVPAQTSPAAGTFTLPVVTTGAQVRVTYRADSTTATGATNSYTWPTTTDPILARLLGTGSDGSGDHVLLDDETWIDRADAAGGRWETVVSGSAPPVAVSTPDDDDWVVAWVAD